MRTGLLALFLCLSRSTFAYLNCCSDLQEIEKSEIHLPESFRHFGEPWYRHNAKVYVSSKLTENWRTAKQQKVQGLNTTVTEMLDVLAQNRCLFLAWGGAVRDLVLGRQPNDIDAAVTCNPHRLKRLCIFKYGSEMCHRPSVGSEKLTIGGPADKFDDWQSVEPMDFAHWNTSFEVHGSHWEFSTNILTLFETEEGNTVLVDLTGYALHDVCARVVRIPTKEAFWEEWSYENNVNKLYRYWKLRANGYAPFSHSSMDFLREATIQRFDVMLFRKFLCHNIFGGTFTPYDQSCYKPHFEPRNQQGLFNFFKVLKEDFGEENYNALFDPIVGEYLAKVE